MTQRSRLTLTALTLIAAGAFAPRAQASGFQLREQSPLSQGNAFAGVSAGGGDISSLFFNPAVMTQYEGWQFSFGGTYVNLSAKFENATATRTPVLQSLGFYNDRYSGASLSPISGPSSHSNAAVSAVLPEFNIMYSVSNDLKLGLSVNVPFGLTTEYDANWIGRYHALKSELKTIDIAPSIAYRVSNSVTIGAAFIARKADAELTNAVDYGTGLALSVGAGMAGAPPWGAGNPLTAPQAIYNGNSLVAWQAMGPAFSVSPGNARPGAWDGKGGLKGDGWGYGWKAGIIFEPSKDFRIGVAYQAAMDMTLKGNATFEYPTDTVFATYDVPALQLKGLKNGKGQADLNLPSTASLGFDWQVTPTLALQGEVARTTWSSFKTLVVKFTDNVAPQTTESVTDENWNDTTFVSLGGTWKLNQAWTLRAGLALDNSAADDAHRTPRIPDNDRKWVSFGCSYQYSKKAIIDIGYSRLFVSDGKVMLSAGTTPTDNNATRGNLNGTIKAAINILGASLRYSF